MVVVGIEGGASDDRDGNEIELYVDVQPALWKDDPAAIFARPRPLRL